MQEKLSFFPLPKKTVFNCFSKIKLPLLIVYAKRAPNLDAFPPFNLVSELFTSPIKNQCKSEARSSLPLMRRFTLKNLPEFRDLEPCYALPTFPL